VPPRVGVIGLAEVAGVALLLRQPGDDLVRTAAGVLVGAAALGAGV